MYRLLLKPLLFQISPEKAHHLTTSLFKIALSLPLVGWLVKRKYRLEDLKLEKTVMGLHFKNPIGLAAGFDKDGKYYKVMSHLGFGFIEIGTVTPLGQEGNEQPRLFRLPEDKALINRMGFNNEGVDAMVSRLKKNPNHDFIIGGNIGKNKVTPNEEAILDYEISFKKLYPLVDYFVVNVSSPNTPNLRALQDKEPLTKLLSHILNLRDSETEQKPILLKIAPDLSLPQIDDVLEVISEVKLDGIIATNTTISRASLDTSNAKLEQIGNGGLSGQPLTKRSLELVQYIRNKMPQLTIIGVGGICSPQDAQAMLAAGADLIQVYSGMVYYGPDLIKDIKKAMLN